jgi:hypothetical protein
MKIALEFNFCMCQLILFFFSLPFACLVDFLDTFSELDYSLMMDCIFHSFSYGT